MVIFRENTEDVYCGIECKQGRPRRQKLIDLLNNGACKKLGKIRAVTRASASSRSAPGLQAPGPHGHPYAHRKQAAQS